MKATIKIWFVLLLLSLGSVSCTDYLDKSPLSDISETDPYKNFTNFQGFIEELYNAIPCISASDYHNCWNLGDDELWDTDTRLFTNAVDEGDYWGWNTRYYSYFGAGYNDINDEDPKKHRHYYGYCWYAIRKANLGIANLDKLTGATQEQRNIIEGQLYFFRGFFHFMLMTYWGGLPYVDSYLTGEETITLPRLSYQATADKVADDLQHAADILPNDWDETSVGQATLGKNNQRANKMTALAFLGKNYLYAGSPLMNKASGGSAAYNADYCKKAADALGQMLKLAESTGKYKLATWDEYTELAYTYNKNGKLPGVNESILYEFLGSATSRFRWNQVNDYRPKNILGSGIKCFPPANYADLFGMKNGLPIADITRKDNETGYDPNYPFRDRDPRFYKNFVFDGMKCVIDGSKVGGDPERQYASLYTDGTFRTTNGTAAARTGYMNMKLCSQYNNDWDGYREDNCMVLSLMRLTDVYLMYAEAVAMGYGTPQSKAVSYDKTALWMVNKIRERAGVPEVHSKYTGSSEAFMSEVQRERAIELSFEGHRFNDLRRWLLLDKPPYNQKKAVYFDRDPSIDDETRFADPANARVLNLREEVIVQRNYTEKHYWFPFLRDDVDMYPEFAQNPGWE